MTWFLARLNEPSSWRGLVWIFTAFGIVLRPEAWEYIAAAGMAVAGLAGMATSDQLFVGGSNAKTRSELASNSSADYYSGPNCRGRADSDSGKLSTRLHRVSPQCKAEQPTVSGFNDQN